MERALPERLTELLDAVTDREVALRVERVLTAAARAIDQLGHLSLVKLEPTTASDEGPDLSLWEKMAPAVRDTVVAVNVLLGAVRADYPEGGAAASEFASNSDDRVDAEAGQVFRAVARRLGTGVNEVGDMVKRPELMGSRWKLLGELQRRRGEFRSLLGDAVYLTAAAIAPARREEVVPGHAQDVARAVLFRRTAADVRRNLEQKLGRKETPARLARLIDQDLDIFFTLPAWRHVPAAAKQEVLGLREGLAALDSLEHLKERVRQVQALLERLAEEHTNGLLVAHDREAVAEVDRKLEQAQLHLSLATGGVGAALSRAVGACEELYGRSGELDDFLRGLRNQSFSELTLVQLGDALGRLKARLHR